jgi:hypothetical protein
MSMKTKRTSARRLGAAALALSGGLAACGGGGDDGGTPPPDVAQRSAAATGTAQNNPACNAIRPFYWEVGDGNLAQASGSVGGSTYTATTPMSIASASKWLYGAYVAEARGATGLSADDVKYLSFRSGYHSMSPLACSGISTVGACQQLGQNDDYTAADDGKFFYNGGHMQKHAVDIGLGALDNAGLADEMRGKLGLTGFAFSQPQPAGGVVTTPNGYAAFLRKVLRNELRINALLGSDPVCTATSCGGVYTPAPSTEVWSYSIGHWVETDPVVGDSAYSSAGAFGFYPWIDRDKRWYGIVARQDMGALGDRAGFESANCGRLIRKAWVAGIVQ